MRQSSKLARLVYSAGCNQSARQLASKAVAQQVPKKETELVSSERLKNETITTPGQAFVGDLRSTSGLGLGDGLETHTSKWLQADVKTGNTKSPMEYIQEAPPIKVHGAVVASYGTDNPALGCPVEYISLKGTSKENPAVCKYTGNKYYSDDWHLAH